MTTVAVALCTYNGARYIGEQLDSILAGTRAPDEIVISDDGSSDGTLDIVQTRLRGRVDVRILRNSTPLGVARNFEQAIAATAADLVALSDQDDIWTSARLAAAVERFEAEPGLLVLHGDARLIDGQGAPLGSTLFDWLGVTPAERAALVRGDAFGVFLRRNVATGATMVVRRAFAESVMPFPPEWVHDEWLATLAAALGGTRAVEEPLVDYRLHGGNQIGAARPTVRYRIRRVLEPEPGRNERLARRAGILAERMHSLGAPSSRVEEVLGKQRFESLRAELPARRLSRIIRIVRWLRSGLYSRFASRGRMDAVRDLLQRR